MVYWILPWAMNEFIQCSCTISTNVSERKQCLNDSIASFELRTCSKPEMLCVSLFHLNCWRIHCEFAIMIGIWPGMTEHQARPCSTKMLDRMIITYSYIHHAKHFSKNVVFNPSGAIILINYSNHKNNKQSIYVHFDFWSAETSNESMAWSAVIHYGRRSSFTASLHQNDTSF